VTAYLAEVAEGEARGSVAAAYGEIRSTIGLPVVNLVYRHLATVPGRLEGVWEQLAPALREPGTRRIADGIAALATAPGVEAIPAASLAAAGVDAATLAAAQATFDAYQRGNATNLIAVVALLHGVEGPASRPLAQPAAPAGEPAGALPAMVAPEQLAPAPRLLMEEMSAAVTGRSRPVLIPSLFRHLTQPAALLALAWTVLRRPLTSADFERRAHGLVAAARVAVPGLALAVPRVEDEDTRAALGRFLEAIPRMLLVGTMLRAAVAEGLADRGIA
jgi:hypothetical protein